ncbi:MAG: hypothetical protein KC422_11200 [Trueperaceae bacterium]|nr:hypothetical protein [Trueperaceae bacterium]
MTKRFFHLVSLTLLVFSLGACTFEGSFQGRVDIDLPPNFSVSNAEYTTNHGNSNGDFEICSNLTTKLTYEFNFSGGNVSWIEYLKFYDINGTFVGSFTPQAINVEEQTSNYIRVSFDIPPSVVPLNALESQAIDIKVGTARFFLEFQNTNKPYQLIADPINVISNCE